MISVPSDLAAIKGILDHGGQVAPEAADEAEGVQLDDEYSARLFV